MPEYATRILTFLRGNVASIRAAFYRARPAQKFHARRKREHGEMVLESTGISVDLKRVADADAVLSLCS